MFGHQEPVFAFRLTCRIAADRRQCHQFRRPKQSSPPVIRVAAATGDLECYYVYMGAS